MNKNTVLALADNPKELEALYRQQPEKFKSVFAEAFSEMPDSLLLRAWNERLFFDDNEQTVSAEHKTNALIWTISLSIITTLLVKAGKLNIISDEAWFYQRFSALFITSAVAVYFLSQYKPSRHVTQIVIGGILTITVFVGLLPMVKNSDTTFLAILYSPIIIWSGVFLAYAGENWCSMEKRMNFIRFNGELLVMSAVILLGGIVLTAITFALFGLIKVNIESWYLNYVVVWGLISSPIVATFLIDKVLENKLRIAALLSKVFAPIFLIMVTAYLTAMFFQSKSPYSDRDFLIIFNILLLIVLAISTFSISEFSQQTRSDVIDAINIALILVTLVIDIIALSAIVYRLSSFGITPNRIAVMGTNLIIFINLVGIAKQYILVLYKDGKHTSIEKWCARYLPVYSTWSLVVVFVLPLAFWFK